MRVFVTGAAGFIGRAVVPELLNNGHQVLGLARNDANAEILTKLGAEVHRGDLEDIESLKSGAKATDGVIHLAFIPDFSDFARVAGIDVAAIEAMGEVLAGTGKPLVIASARGTPFAGRNQGSDAVYALSKDKQVRGSVIRLSPTVHGAEDKGFISMFGHMAQKHGYATYIGDGSARWPAVHRLDAAVLFRLALEKGRAGATYNGVAEEGIPMKSIMEVIGKNLGVPAESKSVKEAAEALGMLAHVLDSDNPTSSQKTKKELGWEPTQPGLLEDIEAHYFLG